MAPRHPAARRCRSRGGRVTRQLVAEGIRFHFDATIARSPARAGAITVTLRAQGRRRARRCTAIAPAGRRRPAAQHRGLGLDAAGVALDQGRIVVDDQLRTTNPHIYVVGDVAGGYQFTHVAEHHAGIVLRHAIFKLWWAKPSKVLPWCTYTDPELARVGLSETEAKQSNIAHRVYRFPFEEIDRARAEGETEGFAKIVTDPKGKLLGAAIVGPHAGELIAEYGLALTQGHERQGHLRRRSTPIRRWRRSAAAWPTSA